MTLCVYVSYLSILESVLRKSSRVLEGEIRLHDLKSVRM